MEHLTSYAQLILEHLEKTPVGNAYDVEGLFRRWDNYVHRVSFFNRYPDMTDHGRAHVNNVVGLVAQVSLPGSRLNPSEIFCLTAAAWLHDIGMYTTGDTNADDVYDAMTIRKKHSVLSRDKMREECEILFPDVPERDVRFISAIAAYHQSRTVLDESHRDAILKADPNADIRVDLPSLEKELADQGWVDGTAVLKLIEDAGEGAKSSSRVRVKLLAALLRVLDQCDIQMNRAGNLDFLLRRVDRSLQQQGVYEELLGSIPVVDTSDKVKRLRQRIQDEVNYFKVTHLHTSRDFWIEKTFIVDGQIYVKLNSESVFNQQIGLVPPSLGKARKMVEEARREIAYYWCNSRDYILKELKLMERYLEAGGLNLKVLPYPEKVSERRELRRKARRFSPYRDPAPQRPADWARPTGIVETVEQVHPAGAVRVLLVYGPHGRGKDQYARELATEVLRHAKEGDSASLWWHVIGRSAQVPDAVQGAAGYFAAQTDFALENVFHDETLVTRRHAEFCINMLRDGDFPQVVVLQDINAVEDRSCWFFGHLLGGLQQKLVIATSTRWTSERRAASLFAGVQESVRFLECPRPSVSAAAELFTKVAQRQAKDGSGVQQLRDSWIRKWQEWGGEPVFLAKLASYGWMARTADGLLSELVDAAMRAHFVSVWDRLSNRKLWEETIRFRDLPEGQLHIESEPSPEALDLVDRGLARWGEVEASDPWQGDDVIVLRIHRPESRTILWLHPGLRRVLGLTNVSRVSGVG
jgi:hypothetical protein